MHWRRVWEENKIFSCGFSQTKFHSLAFESLEESSTLLFFKSTYIYMIILKVAWCFDKLYLLGFQNTKMRNIFLYLENIFILNTKNVGMIQMSLAPTSHELEKNMGDRKLSYQKYF